MKTLFNSLLLPFNFKLWSWLLILTFNHSVLTIAQNLVPNPSFEEYIWCPDANGQSSLANGWLININSTDYYNQCSSISSGVSVPQNDLGFQYPYAGQAYTGFVAYLGCNSGYEEFIGCRLIDSLVIGQKYFVSFKINCAYSIIQNTYCAVNKIGVLFTNKLYSDTSQYPPGLIVLQYPFFVNNFAHVYTDSIIKDTLNWTVISGSFVADSSYKYMMIGNFFDHAHTSIFCYDTTYDATAYYYLDDICVSADSSDCFTSIGIQTNTKVMQPIMILPNPAHTEIGINVSLPNSRISIVSVQGRLIKSFSGNRKINISTLENGLYLIKIQTPSKFIVKKLIKF